MRIKISTLKAEVSHTQKAFPHSDSPAIQNYHTPSIEMSNHNNAKLAHCYLFLDEDYAPKRVCDLITQVPCLQDFLNELSLIKM